MTEASNGRGGSPRANWIPSLTGIRGVAAVWVVILHSTTLYGHIVDSSLVSPPRILACGFLAVDLFFILSGFILAKTYLPRFGLDPNGTMKRFYIGRLWRIMPLNSAVLLAFLLAVTMFPQKYFTSEQLKPSSFFASLFLVQAWGFTSPTTWNVPSWSLSTEWLAYAVFPLLLIILARTQTVIRASVGLAAMLLTLVLLMATAGHGTLDHVWLLGMPRCLLQFAAGGFLYCLLDLPALKTLAIPGQDITMLAGVSLLILVVMFKRCELLAPFSFALMITSCASNGRLSAALFGNPIALQVGEISFSLYLVHFVLICLWHALFAQYGSIELTYTARLTYFLTVFPVIFAISWMTWRFVELPCQQMSRHLLTRQVRSHISSVGATRR